MSFALVFSGQGNQHPGMLPWLADDDLVEATSAALGVPHWRAFLERSGRACGNAVAQPLLTGLALAAWQQIAPALPAPAAVAGYSVGELAAFSAAGVFDAPTALRLAQRRAEAMDRCASRSPGGLLAVSGLAADVTVRTGARDGLAVAIRNGIDSVVLGGASADLDRAEPALAQLGGRCKRLCVGLASHTPALQEAAEEFATVLAEARLERPRVPLFSNAADRIRDAAQARHALATQIATTVHWDECMDGLHARGVTCVLEIGPGQALARMWNARYPRTPARSCDEFRSAAGVAHWVRAHADA